MEQQALAVVLEATEAVEQPQPYVHKQYVPSLSSSLLGLLQRTEQEPPKPREMSVDEMIAEARRLAQLYYDAPLGSAEERAARKEYRSLREKVEAILGRSPFGCGFRG